MCRSVRGTHSAADLPPDVERPGEPAILIPVSADGVGSNSPPTHAVVRTGCRRAEPPLADGFLAFRILRRVFGTPASGTSAHCRESAAADRKRNDFELGVTERFACVGVSDRSRQMQAAELRRCAPPLAVNASRQHSLACRTVRSQGRFDGRDQTRSVTGYHSSWHDSHKLGFRHVAFRGGILGLARCGRSLPQIDGVNLPQHQPFSRCSCQPEIAGEPSRCGGRS
jgi:hypothetical protein